MVLFLKKMSLVYKPLERRSPDTLMSLALASGVIGFLAQSMFDYTFYNYRVMAIFIMVLALGVSFIHVKKGAVRE